MNPFIGQAKRGLVTESFANTTETFWVRKSRILILTDGRIEVLSDAEPRIGTQVTSSAFGLSIAIGELRKFASGFSSFPVTVATRDGPETAKPGFDLTSFRFSVETLAKFDQVWLFGLWPDNIGGDPLWPVYDVLIDKPEHHPLSDEELNALARWMDNRGGVFAAGDHWLLGATMCHKVPRVSLMRAWTMADGVTSQFSVARHETTRPYTVEERKGDAIIDSYLNEADSLPQEIEWEPFQRSPITTTSRPHPLLCHPDLGPIDVLPDHMHEGRCFDFNDPSWQADKRDTSFDFAGYANPHFPASGSLRPLPQVVAWGTTLAAPPLQFRGGHQPYRRFPLIAAYDGQQIGVGRVVTDSTWHHWFDFNVKGMIDYAAVSGNRTVIDKIRRYWVNVGIYLASPEWRMGLMLGWLKGEQFNYFGRQAISLEAPAPELGRAAIVHLRRALGACWVSEIVTDVLARAPMWPMLRAKFAGIVPTPYSLTFDEIEASVIGEVVRAAYSDMNELRDQIGEKGEIDTSPLFRNLYDVVAEAGERGLRLALEIHRRELQLAIKQLDGLDEAMSPRQAT